MIGAGQAEAARLVAEAARRGAEFVTLPEYFCLMGRRDTDKLAVLVWHYHDDDVAGPAAAVRVNMSRLPQRFGRGATVVQYRIDDSHANAFAAWRAMGSPIAPTDAQRAALIKAAALDTSDSTPTPLGVTRGTATLSLALPRQGVSLLIVTPAGRGIQE